MTDNVIHTRATALGIAQVSKCGWRMLVLVGEVSNKSVDFVRRDSRRDVLTQIVHELSVELPGKPHPVTLNLCQLKLANILQHANLETVASI